MFLNHFFNEKPIKVGSVDISILNFGIDDILIYKSKSNSTTNESIQLRIKYGKEEEVIRVYEHYDLVLEHKLNGDSLFLILKDTSGYRDKVNTLVFDLNTLKK